MLHILLAPLNRNFGVSETVTCKLPHKFWAGSCELSGFSWLLKYTQIQEIFYAVTKGIENPNKNRKCRCIQFMYSKLYLDIECQN